MLAPDVLVFEHSACTQASRFWAAASDSDEEDREAEEEEDEEEDEEEKKKAKKAAAKARAAFCGVLQVQLGGVVAATPLPTGMHLRGHGCCGPCGALATGQHCWYHSCQ